MRTSFRKSFLRDLKKVKSRAILKRVRQAIEEVESAATLAELADLTKLAGSIDCYRIRIGDYRLGVVVEGDLVEFVRCLPRRDLYRFFP
ncbi:MAG: type II toxin-antitoxin system RelE/ParE family toxin [Planctomycetes bacterium]|nr:type II toxin-antitoxin system RelE/ParE family toxin [Planctomycetota bacterium]